MNGLLNHVPVAARSGFTKLCNSLRYVWLRHALAMTLVAVGPAPMMAQTEMACGAAIQQLQAYVNQVNSIAQMEYNRGIPQRCGYNGYCAQAMLQQLGAWYSQQSMLVNQWYGTISRQCSSPTQSSSVRRKRQTDPAEEIEDVDDLEVDNHDKTVRIRIPSNPSGYRTRSR